MPEPRPAVLVVEHEGPVGLGRLGPVLAATADLDVRRLHRGDPLPAGLDGYAGLVVLGGTMGAGDDDVAPWLPATRRLLAAGVEADVPVLGICLGAQLLAVAAGGRVERGSRGLEAGLVEVVATAAADGDPLLGPVTVRCGRRPAVPQFHQDAVTVLPPGAVLLASGERYPHQAYRVGRRAWGLQYHPEVSAADFAGWVHGDLDAVTAAGLRAPDVLTAYAAAEPHLADLATAHAEAFAAIMHSETVPAPSSP